MGGIIGSGIFRNPSVVAAQIHTPMLAMLEWVLGGVIALVGAFLFAELAARRPHDGGLYAYMRDAYHPIVAFMYGWTLLLVSQSGGMAAAALTFAGYFEPLTGLHVSEPLLAFTVLAIFTIVNCLGVREGSTLQNVFMVLKIGAIVLLIGAGLFAHPVAAASLPASAQSNALAAMGVALIPVLFAYSGWQTSSFMTAELKEPQRTLPLGMIWGVVGVVVLYLLVNYVCLHVLGIRGLMSTDAPASDVMRAFMGPRGAQIIAAVIALSTLGFLSNQILTSPRVYHAMAEDGSFFPQLAWVHPITRVPVIAIALQGFVAAIITFWKGYAQILNYVTSIDYTFFALSALALFIFRARDRAHNVAGPAFRIPLHPFSTALFLAIAVVTVGATYVSTFQSSGWNVLITPGILLIAIPIYYGFRSFTKGSLVATAPETGLSERLPGN
jgi:APA family basic amino acid/polyamine antiporter